MTFLIRHYRKRSAVSHLNVSSSPTHAGLTLSQTERLQEQAFSDSHKRILLPSSPYDYFPSTITSVDCISWLETGEEIRMYQQELAPQFDSKRYAVTLGVVYSGG